jgi:hypothetical protein
VVGDRARVSGRHERHSFVQGRHFRSLTLKKRGLEGVKRKKVGILVERTMAGALRADGQQRMIGGERNVSDASMNWPIHVANSTRLSLSKPAG